MKIPSIISQNSCSPSSSLSLSLANSEELIIPAGSLTHFVTSEIQEKNFNFKRDFNKLDQITFSAKNPDEKPIKVTFQRMPTALNQKGWLAIIESENTSFHIPINDLNLLEHMVICEDEAGWDQLQNLKVKTRSGANLTPFIDFCPGFCEILDTFEENHICLQQASIFDKAGQLDPQDFNEINLYTSHEASLTHAVRLKLEEVSGQWFCKIGENKSLPLVNPEIQQQLLALCKETVAGVLKQGVTAVDEPDTVCVACGVASGLLYNQEGDDVAGYIALTDEKKSFTTLILALMRSEQSNPTALGAAFNRFRI